MLVDVHLELVACRTGIAVPNVALSEAHLVEHLGGKSGPMIGQAFGITEATVHRLHDAALAAHIPGRAAVPQHRAQHHLHRIARLKAPPPGACEGVHHGILALDTGRPAFACRARTSAMRASTSARVKSSCSTTKLRSARIHFS